MSDAELLVALVGTLPAVRLKAHCALAVVQDPGTQLGARDRAFGWPAAVSQHSCESSSWTATESEFGTYGGMILPSEFRKRVAAFFAKRGRPRGSQ
jgi:hypothetical protein